MASRKQLAQLDILAVTNLTDPGSGFVGFSAKMDGLYQKIGAAADARLLTAVDIGVNVAAYNHSHPYLLLSGGVMSNTNVVTNLNADLLDGQHGSYYATAAHNHPGVYQPLDADLTAIASLVGTSGLLKKTAADTWALDTTTYVSGTPWTAMGYVTGTPWTGMGYVTGTPWTGMGYLTANQAHTLDSHSNVTITSNAAGEILKWSGTAWINNTLAEAGIQPAGSYVTGIPWTGMGYITGGPYQPLATNLTSLAGLTYASASFVKMTAAGMFTLDTTAYVTGTPWTGMGYLTANQAHTLDSHSNVTITSNAAGEILKWSGTVWINNTLAEAGIQPAGIYITGTPWTGMGYITGGPYQPLATNLTSLSTLTYASGSFVKMTAAGTFALDTTTYAGLNGSSSQAFNVLELDMTNGYVAKGTASAFEIYNGGWLLHIDTSGNVTVPTGAVMEAANFNLQSDARFKHNINPINLPDISKINFVEFSMKADLTNRKRYGVIAQELEKIAPELVYTNSDGMKSVAYIDLLVAKIADLEKRLKKHENEK